MTEPLAQAEELCGLIVQQPGKPQQVLTRYLRMILNFRYGLAVKVVGSLIEGCSIIQKNPAAIVCTFIVQDEEIDSRSVLDTLSQRHRIPLLLFLPDRLAKSHRALHGRLPLMTISTWEKAFNGTSSSIRETIDRAFRAGRIDALFGDEEQLSRAELQKKVERRVRNLPVLPTLPQVVLQIMKRLEDPRTTIEDMEKVISSDPAIVWKLLEVIKAPAFAGRRRSEWTLREVIVRLGMRKVGALAQQIKLMNSFVKPEESPLDLGRFWKHSLGCAIVADRLCATDQVSFDRKIPFDEYWIGGLLHDIGKLVLGVFFPWQFEQVQADLASSRQTSRDFRQAEARIGYPGLHEEVARLLLLKANAGSQLVDAVGAHHAHGEAPGDLACLLHLADNLGKDLGLGYLQQEQGKYSRAVLRKLDLTPQDLQDIKASLGGSVVAEVEDVVRRSTAQTAREPGERPATQRRTREEAPPAPAAPAAHEPDGVAQLSAILDQLREKLRQSTALTREQRDDLLVDVDILRAQFNKHEPNRTVVFAVIDALSRVESCGDLVTRLERLLAEH